MLSWDEQQEIRKTNREAKCVCGHDYHSHYKNECSGERKSLRVFSYRVFSYRVLCNCRRGHRPKGSCYHGRLICDFGHPRGWDAE